MAQRGFTLLELLTTMAISSTVIAGITMTFVSQAQSYQSHAGRRSSLASSRNGTDYLEKVLRRTGYGVDPWRAMLAYDGFNVTSPTTGPVDGYPDAITVHQ